MWHRQPCGAHHGSCGSGEELNLSIFPMDAPSSCPSASSGKDRWFLFSFCPHAAGGAAHGINPGCAALQGKDSPSGCGPTMGTGLGTAQGSFTPCGVTLRFQLMPQALNWILNSPQGWPTCSGSAGAQCQCPVPLLLGLQLLLHIWRWFWEQGSSTGPGEWEWDGSAFGALWELGLLSLRRGDLVHVHQDGQELDPVVPSARNRDSAQKIEIQEASLFCFEQKGVC